MGISASLIRKTRHKRHKKEKWGRLSIFLFGVQKRKIGRRPRFSAPFSFLWRPYFFNILTRAEKCRPDDSDNVMNIGESTFASMNRGLNRLNRFVAPIRNAIRFPLANGIGTSFSIPTFVEKNMGNFWPL